jgi:chromosome segregation ATPase
MESNVDDSDSFLDLKAAENASSSTTTFSNTTAALQGGGFQLESDSLSFDTQPILLKLNANTPKQKGNSLKFNNLKAYLAYIRKIAKSLSNEKSKNLRLQANLRQCVQEKLEASRMLKSSQEKRHAIKSELDEFRKLKSAEIRSLREELELVSREYSQIMYERDTVNKEIDALQEKLFKIEETYRTLHSSLSLTNSQSYDTSRTPREQLLDECLAESRQNKPPPEELSPRDFRLSPRESGKRQQTVTNLGAISSFG